MLTRDWGRSGVDGPGMLPRARPKRKNGLTDRPGADRWGTSRFLVSRFGGTGHRPGSKAMSAAKPGPLVAALVRHTIPLGDYPAGIFDAAVCTTVNSSPFSSLVARSAKALAADGCSARMACSIRAA